MNFSDLLTPTTISTQFNKLPVDILLSYEDCNFSDYDVFIVGYAEDRNSENAGAGTAADSIRTQLYSLFTHSKSLKICDLGNCKLGKTVKDSYMIVKELCSLLHSYKKPLILIGGTQEITCTLAQERLKDEEFPTLTCIDAKIDLHANGEDFHHTNYIAQLTNTYVTIKVNHIAVQEYLSHPNSFEFLTAHNFPYIRLGNVLHNTKHTEPMLREAQLVSFDTTALRVSEFDANRDTLPAGVYVEDACQMAWYAGFSQEMNTFVLSEYNPTRAVNSSSSAAICALILWYVLDGISQRNPIPNNRYEDVCTIHYVKNNVMEHDVRFFEHTVSKQMWVELPLPDYNTKRILPCSFSDYQLFSHGEIPENWIMELRRANKR
ncbi:MAG: arginase family protein [Bacteroidales bacterium]|jgi:formiminoglutamase|nr:arginase family protein [Bacteroidales bacterium]